MPCALSRIRLSSRCIEHIAVPIIYKLMAIGIAQAIEELSRVLSEATIIAKEKMIIADARGGRLV